MTPDLQLADFVVTSTGFPSAWTGVSAIEVLSSREGAFPPCLMFASGSPCGPFDKAATCQDAIPEMAARLPHVKLMITTLGSKGSVMLESEAQAANANEAVLSEARRLQRSACAPSLLPLPHFPIKRPTPTRMQICSYEIFESCLFLAGAREAEGSCRSAAKPGSSPRCWGCNGRSGPTRGSFVGSAAAPSAAGGGGAGAPRR